MKKEGGNTIGRMKVRIKLTNSDNNAVLFDQAKIFTAQKTEMKVSLDAFKKIQRGEYDFTIDAVDMFTGKEDNFLEKVRVR
jgi:5-hydroxyisourate hydrolase-like protein (transthyretin family)